MRKLVSRRILPSADLSSFNEQQVIVAASQRPPRELGFLCSLSHQIALTTTLQHATCDAVVLFDSGLQDPPDVMAQIHLKCRRTNYAFLSQ